MIFLVFLIPIGVMVYMYEKKIFKQNKIVLEGYIKQEISENKDITIKEKIKWTQQLLDNNNYKVVKKDDKYIIGEKKIFSIGLLFIGMFVFYIVYYYFFQKPDILAFRSDNVG